MHHTRTVLGKPHAEHAARPPAEDDDRHREDDRVEIGVERARQQRAAADFDEGEQETPGYRGREAAETADDAGDEALEHRVEAGRRDDVGHDGEEEQPGDAGEQAGDGKGADDHGVGADAHQPGDREIVRCGTHAQARGPFGAGTPSAPRTIRMVAKSVTTSSSWMRNPPTVTIASTKSGSSMLFGRGPKTSRNSDCSPTDTAKDVIRRVSGCAPRSRR